jgi:hypothetical protein
MVRDSASKAAQPMPGLPNPLQCALLLLALVEAKQDEVRTEITRLRLSQLTLTKLWGRQRLGRELVDEIKEWLHRAGWVLFEAGRMFAMIKIDRVESWPRLTSKHMAGDLSAVFRSEYEYERLYKLVTRVQAEED